MDFSKIDNSIDLKAFQRDINSIRSNGGSNEPFVPLDDGQYEVRVQNMEIRGTKADPNRPMLAVVFEVISGKDKGKRIFFNRVLYGTKNDANMVKSAIGFLKKLESNIDVNFESYQQFSDVVDDIEEDINGRLEYAITWKSEEFNSVTIDEVYEVD